MTLQLPEPTQVVKARTGSMIYVLLKTVLVCCRAYLGIKFAIFQWCV